MILRRLVLFGSLMVLLNSLNIALSFAGCVAGDCKNGHGTYITEKGNRYTGNWVNGQMNGRGIYTWANGDQYVGNFVDDKFSGRGTLTRIDGTTYEGEWVNDKKSGQGTYTWPDVTTGTSTDNEMTEGGTLTKPEAPSNK